MKDVSLCTGCGACAEICPHNAISLTFNEDGFLFPVINASLCVNCGACHKVCATYDSIEETSPIASYSAYAASPLQRESGSSGGVFGVLAERILKDGGVVFGAIFSAEQKKVLHISTTEASLSLLKRSKYAQSDTGHTFSEVQAFLKKGAQVLYVGTPCQIEGLKSFLGKEYENLYTMDFICHGVPSPLFFRDTLAHHEKEHGKRIVDFTFREKKQGWRKLSINLYFEDGTTFAIKSHNHCYYYSFLKNYTLRKSCFSCERYKSAVSDITVADYWNVPHKKDDDCGFSLVFLNTQKGKTLFFSEEKNFIMEPYLEKSRERFSHKNYVLQKRERFFEFYRQHGGEKTIKKYQRKMQRETSLRRIKEPFQKGLQILVALKRRMGG